MDANVGKVRLRKISELQSDFKDNEAIFAAETKTPEKQKKARKVRAATTIKKKNTQTEAVQQIIVSSTAIKRTGKKEPLPGQLRIDSFFKSCTKSYNVETKPEKSPSNSKPCRKLRKGCKRLFDEESTTCSDVEYKTKPTRKRTLPQRKAKAKAKCNIISEDVIDLCSDAESVSERKDPCDKLNESKPPMLRILEPRQSEVPPMLSIPCDNLRLEMDVDAGASSKENIAKGRKRKRCPPYKVVEGTTFVVDGFQFGDIPNATHYFLSHYHADHYVGLTRKFAHPLYVSPITARLVRTFIPIDNQYLHEIDVDQSITLNGIEVTAIDANHCPGALMLLFKLPTSECILHTGDFRASFEMESLPIFWNHLDIDLLYLDTTYLAKNYAFCHQTESIDRLCFLVHQFHEKHADKRILHVCGSYLIGKEKVWLKLAEEFALRIWTEPHRRKAIDCLNWPEQQLRFCDDPLKANLHVINMGKISYPQLDQYFKPFEGHFDMLLGIRPSGWEKNSKPSYGKRISVIGVEYSEHSSYKELERFVRFLKPKRVISTVPVQRDLCVTASVPVKWYQFKGCAGMLSTSYQPSISTYFEKPQRKLPPLVGKSSNMILSPLEEGDNVSSDDFKSCVTVNNNQCEAKPEVASDTTDAAVQPVSRLTSDASDDLLSFI